MGHGETGFLAEGGKGLIWVHIEVARVGAHIARDEAGRVKCAGITVFDCGDIGGFDAQFALHVEQGFTKRGPFAAHDIPQPQFECIEPFGFDCFVLSGSGGPSPDHQYALSLLACSFDPNTPQRFGCSLFLTKGYHKTTQNTNSAALARSFGTIQRTMRPEHVHPPDKCIHLFRPMYR